MHGDSSLQLLTFFPATFLNKSCSVIKKNKNKTQPVTLTRYITRNTIYVVKFRAEICIVHIFLAYANSSHIHKFRSHLKWGNYTLQKGSFCKSLRISRWPAFQELWKDKASPWKQVEDGKWSIQNIMWPNNLQWLTRSHEEIQIPPKCAHFVCEMRKKPVIMLNCFLFLNFCSPTSNLIKLPA